MIASEIERLSALDGKQRLAVRPASFEAIIYLANTP
jgi:hypothetical protein